MDLRKQLRRAGIPEDMVLSVDGKPLTASDGKPADRWGQFKSKWEMLYSMELEDAKKFGTILHWQYEPIRLRLTDPSRDANGKAIRPIFYTPDFAVWRLAVPVQTVLGFIEVKGYRRTKDVNRFKLARDKFPHFEFTMVTMKQGKWIVMM